jgi:hypothetical protein
VAPLDTDKDGMPDEWEKKHGLDPAKDDSAKVMPGGYTAIEVYVNERAEVLVREASTGDKLQGNHAQQQR